MSKARVNSLESVVSAQRAFFRSTRSVAEAFPEYSAVDLSDPVAVDGLLVRLDDSVSAQFAVKKKDIPALGDQRRVDKVWAQRRAELDIAGEVNAGRRKFLLGVRTHLRARPRIDPFSNRARRGWTAYVEAGCAPGHRRHGRGCPCHCIEGRGPG